MDQHGVKVESLRSIDLAGSRSQGKILLDLLHVDVLSTRPQSQRKQPLMRCPGRPRNSNCLGQGAMDFPRVAVRQWSLCHHDCHAAADFVFIS